MPESLVPVVKFLLYCIAAYFGLIIAAVGIVVLIGVVGIIVMLCESQKSKARKMAMRIRL